MVEKKRCIEHFDKFSVTSIEMSRISSIASFPKSRNLSFRLRSLPS